jgi:hypothetical protein
MSVLLSGECFAWEMRSAYHRRLESSKERRQNKNASEARKPRSRLFYSLDRRLGLHENDHERKQNQRFNQRQTQNHHGLNLRRRTRITRRAFASRRTDA